MAMLTAGVATLCHAMDCISQATPFIHVLKTSRKYFKCEMEKLEDVTRIYHCLGNDATGLFLIFFQDIIETVCNCISAASKTRFQATMIHESPIMCIY